MKKHCLNMLKSRKVLITILLAVAAVVPLLVGQMLETVVTEDYNDQICIRDIGDFEAVFLEHQFDYLRIVPPSVDFVLVQPYHAPLFFDPAGFPKYFSDNLIGEYTRDGIPEYEVRVYEDPATREIKFLNDANQLLETLAAPVGYNPYSYVSSFYPALYTSSYSDTERDWLQALYDPSRVQGIFRLIPREYAEKYTEAVKKQILRSKPGRIKDEPIVRRSAGSSNELWLAISNMVDGANVEISINVPTGIQTNHLEIYTTEDLLTFWWDIAASNLVAGLGTNVITWTHDASAITNKTVLYYTAGNVDVDSDGDDLADTHERFLHHTDPGDTDTDDDLLTDGEEVNTHLTDPLQEDTDGDYSPDGYEVAHSTDPLSATSFPTVSVSGTISYGGMWMINPIRVIAVPDSNSWISTFNAELIMMNPNYTISSVPGGGQFWIKAYYDDNTNGVAEPCEALGAYTNGWICATGNLTGIDFFITEDWVAPVLQTPSNTAIACGESLEPTNTGEAVATDTGWGVLLLTYTDTVTVVYSNFDRIVMRKWTAEDYCTNSVTQTQTIHQALCDSDADNLPDEWEQQIVDFDLMDGITNFYDVVSTNDFDEDGLTNGEEFELGTDPTALDSDLDWAGDAYEVAEETDPTSATSLPSLKMIINSGDLLTDSTNLSLTFPGIIADSVTVSESAYLSNGTTVAMSDPVLFDLPDQTNKTRLLYAVFTRTADTNESPGLMSGIILDTDPPTVTITNPVSNFTTSRRWINLEGTVTDTVSQVQVLIASNYADGVVGGNYIYTRYHLEEGTNIISVYGTDLAGNVGTQTVTVVQDFTDDTNAPSLTLNLPLDYEISGGVTNWLNTTTYGSNEVLFLNGTTDDETAEIEFLVVCEGQTNGPFSGTVQGTQVWGRVELSPGTNLLTALIDDAAGNVSTGTCAIVRDTNFLFEITDPVAYQVLNVRSTMVHGVASPNFLNATITVNGVVCDITDNGSNIAFETVSEVSLNVERTAISAAAILGGRVYYADPVIYSYSLLHDETEWVHYIDDNWGNHSYNNWYEKWDAANQLHEDYQYYPSHYVVNSASSSPLTWHGVGADIDFNYARSAGVSDLIVWQMLWFSKLDFIISSDDKDAPQTVNVLFTFNGMEYSTNVYSVYSGMGPTNITFRGARGFALNETNVGFVVPLRINTRYTFTETDFTWPMFPSKTNYFDGATYRSKWGTAHTLEFGPVQAEVLPMMLVPNYDRDDDIDYDDRCKAAVGECYYFWINDDDDFGAVGGEDVPGQSEPDWDGAWVDGELDLIDFFAVHLDIKDVLEMLPSTDYDYILKHSEFAFNVVINLGLTSSQADYHLYNKTFCLAHKEDGIEWVDSGGCPLPSAFLSAIENDDKGIILLEGRTATDEPLVLEVRKKSGGAVILRKEMPIHIDGIENMYRHINLRPDSNGHATAIGEPANYPDDLCSSKNLFFLHGFSVSGEEARGWNAEMFKRLFWSGSKARFWGVTWQGDLGLVDGLNYQEDVANCFLVASNLCDEISSVPNKTVMAHSLGNMVVSAAIEDYGLEADSYLMLNAAVALECYDPTKFNTQTVTNYMVHEDWDGYYSNTWCSTWHQLFTNQDDRAKLTWKDRFPSVLDVAYNFRSEGDEAFEIYPGTPGAFSGGLFHLERYAWHKQEIFKGLTGPGTTDWAGWGFSGEYSQAEANAASNEMLMTNAVFRQEPSGMFSSNIATQLQNEILALGIPALSGAAGRLLIEDIDNYDMNDHKPNDWPRSGGEYDDRWLHTDIKNVAYMYVFDVFKQIVSSGGLK
ncbi:MAG: hypothetical protein AB7T27_07260 [Kiritimatiellia bacterium]